MHQTVGNILRTYLYTQPLHNQSQAQNIIDSALASASYATRCAIHQTLQISPGALVFQRDMILDIPIIADLEYIKNKRQVLIDENLRPHNLTRHSHDYTVGEEILVLTYNPSKLDPRAEGPYTIHQVHVNGTISYFKTRHVLKRINIQ